MVDWITPPTFVDNDPIRAEYLQALWEDLYILKNPLLSAQFNSGGGNSTWTFTGVGAWVDIDTTAYQMEFESSGNPLLVWAVLRPKHSAANGACVFRFVLDGVAQGGTYGQGFHANITQPETRTLSTIMEDVEAGDHTIKVQVANETAGTASVYQYQCMGLIILEF